MMVHLIAWRRHDGVVEEQTFEAGQYGQAFDAAKQWGAVRALDGLKQVWRMINGDWVSL